MGRQPQVGWTVPVQRPHPASHLFNFRQARGYFPREENALAGIDLKWLNTGAIEVFTPDEMRRLLAVAKPEIVPFLTIGAVAGLRSAEITRLDWSEVNLSKRFIEVKATKTKTASRRIAPVVDNLAAWLVPYAKSFGPVCELVRPEKSARDYPACATKRKWKRNGLRHSFVSYRLAAMKACLERHARELVIDLDGRHRVHGLQEGRHFKPYYEGYCLLPLYAFVGDVPCGLLCVRATPTPTSPACSPPWWTWLRHCGNAAPCTAHRVGRQRIRAR